MADLLVKNINFSALAFIGGALLLNGPIMAYAFIWGLTCAALYLFS